VSCIVQVRYTIIEAKEFARIGYNGFLFPHSYSGDGLGATPSPEYECGKRNLLYPINNSVVKKINGMAYIFTLLMFRKPNKTQINKFVSVNVFSILVYI
jgi:hypothetical protein